MAKQENSVLNRPAIVTDEHLDYLDVLRDSGVTNMFGARPYLMNAFKLEKEDASTILSYWMESFSSKKENEK